MKKMFPGFLLLIFPLLGICQLSQKEESIIDSLKNVIATSNHDSDKINAYFDWDNMIYIQS